MMNLTVIFIIKVISRMFIMSSFDKKWIRLRYNILSYRKSFKEPLRDEFKWVVSCEKMVLNFKYFSSRNYIDGINEQTKMEL